MAPEVLARKLVYLRKLLADLEIYRDATAAEVLQDHYAVERILELLVMTASDIVFHLLAVRDIHPGSYRESFKLAAEQGMLPAVLADRLGDAASMRNVIAHMYESIDYAILHSAVVPALEDFDEFVDICASFPNELPEYFNDYE